MTKKVVKVNLFSPLETSVPAVASESRSESEEVVGVIQPGSIQPLRGLWRSSVDPDEFPALVRSCVEHCLADLERIESKVGPVDMIDLNAPPQPKYGCGGLVVVFAVELTLALCARGHRARIQGTLNFELVPPDAMF